MRLINTSAEVRKEAFLRGRAWDPDSKYDNLKNLDLAAVEKMNGNELDAKLLVESYQRSSIRYNYLVEAFHQRFEPNYDGEVGEATLALANSPRCPLPDFSPPPTASFYYDDPELQSAVERMQLAKQIEAATGSGSWKPGCYSNPKIHEITINYDESKLSTKQKQWMLQFKAHNTAAVAAMGLKVREVPLSQFANVNFYGRNFSGGTIGMAQFNNTSCNDRVFCTVSPSYAPNIRMFIILGMHEFGHTMNFEHSNRFIMNPFIMDVPEFWVIRDSNGIITYTDVRYAKGDQFFGGDPIDPIIIPPADIIRPVLSGPIYAENNLFGGISIRGKVPVEIKEGVKPGIYNYIVVPDTTTGSDTYTFAPASEI